MSDDSKEQERSLYLRLLLGLLPFNVDITVEVINDLLSEADNTSWPSVMRRSANLGLILGTVGLVGSMIIMYQLANLSNTPLRHVGPVYRIGFALVILMWIAKAILQFIQNIDTGHSPLIPEEEQPSKLTALFEFFIGVTFIGMITIPLYEIWNQDILFVIMVVVAAVGIALAGICLTISGAYDFLAKSSKPTEDVSLEQAEDRRGD